MENVVVPGSTQEIPGLTKRDKIGLTLVWLAVVGVVTSGYILVTSFYSTPFPDVIGFICKPGINSTDPGSYMFACGLGHIFILTWAYIVSFVLYIIGSIVITQKRFRPGLIIGGILIILVAALQLGLEWVSNS